MESVTNDLLQKLYKLRERHLSSLHESISELKAELEPLRTGIVSKKIPVVDEPARTPEKCFRDYLISEILWLQNDMMSERKLKKGLAKKLGKEMLKHKYVVDRREGVDIVEQNLRRVSATLAGEVEKFWKGVRQLADHRTSKQQQRVKRAENQRKLDELVNRTEKFVESGNKRLRVDNQVDEKKKRLDEISMEMTAAQPTGNSYSTTNVSIAVPSLLRANLREYQHIGLQWLATLHARNLNGILADEMGLGKTLQTIALLAHLACDKGIWGPHLIVVPTSVMINWEIELKKFLPGFKVMVYFGTPKERRMKRVGWRDDNIFNVCICSYALVLQDALVFRKKNWHYLILDEAHQIKNFKSQRWQNLLTFKTVRRLLLTGTPLQNDLIELWSLLHFLMPGIFTSHLEFQEWFSEPLSKAIEKNKLDDSHSSGLISRLHALIRPFLLRRLKKDVETQMPSKFEHVIPVPLSLRQKVLYDEFITHREKFFEAKQKNSSYLGLMNVLMQLRKVCNHPDLLEPRPVKSPFVMKNILIPRRNDYNGINFEKLIFYFNQHPYLRPGISPLNISSIFAHSILHTETVTSKHFFDPQLVCKEEKRLPLLKEIWKNRKSLLDPSPYLENEYIARIQEQTHSSSLPELHFSSPQPSLGADCIRFLRREFFPYPIEPPRLVQFDWYTLKHFVVCLGGVYVMKNETEESTNFFRNFFDFVTFFDKNISKNYSFSSSTFSCIDELIHKVKSQSLCQLPDKNFLEWDCGKFKVLKSLLRRLHSENHKVILFTQMSKMLDIIEAFANLCGFTYVRLDGATKVADRQLIVDRFNRDKKLFLFISSTRAGGVGINLTGADTVIFFDSDWNPAMDRQAMDRCHRIGQVRDVNVYRLVSEKTIEESIFAKQLQKRKLDEIVIDKGHFTSTSDAPSGPSGGLIEELFQTSTTPSENRSSIYGTHTLWERKEEETGADDAQERGIFSQVEDPEDVVVTSTSRPEEKLDLPDDHEDAGYLKLPEIVRHSVSYIESDLLALSTNNLEAIDSENEWEDLENAAWNSQSESEDEEEEE